MRHSPRWKYEDERLKARLRARKAIVAVARRLLGLMVALLKSGRPYDPAWPVRQPTAAGTSERIEVSPVPAAG